MFLIKRASAVCVTEQRLVDAVVVPCADETCQKHHSVSVKSQKSHCLRTDSFENCSPVSCTELARLRNSLILQGDVWKRCKLFYNIDGLDTGLRCKRVPECRYIPRERLATFCMQAHGCPGSMQSHRSVEEHESIYLAEFCF